VINIPSTTKKSNLLSQHVQIRQLTSFVTFATTLTRQQQVNFILPESLKLLTGVKNALSRTVLQDILGLVLSATLRSSRVIIGTKCIEWTHMRDAMSAESS
jgi:hypothetical protein